LLAASDLGVITEASEVHLPDFADAVEMNKGMVFSIGWHFFRDRVTAEELAQDVFVHLYRNYSKIRSPEHLVFWLRKVTAQRAIDLLRKRKQHLETSLDEAAEPTVFERMHDTLLCSYLERMVASLPQKQRLAIILRYQEDMEPSEIAEVLGEKVSSVKTLIARGLELLRRKTSERLGSTSERANDGSV
jgi:RNA polymerase sigma-70 factor (ECF subfamily)